MCHLVPSGYSGGGLGPLGQKIALCQAPWVVLPLLPFLAWSVTLSVGGPQSLKQPSPSSPVGPWQHRPHWLHISLETRHQQCKHRLQNVSSLPHPLPHRHEASVHLPEPSLLAGTHPEGGRCQGCLEHQLWPQAPKGGAHAQEAAPAGPLQVSLGSGAITSH